MNNFVLTRCARGLPLRLSLIKEKLKNSLTYLRKGPIFFLMKAQLKFGDPNSKLKKINALPFPLAAANRRGSGRAHSNRGTQKINDH